MQCSLAIGPPVSSKKSPGQRYNSTFPSSQIIPQEFSLTFLQLPLLHYLDVCLFMLLYFCLSCSLNWHTTSISSFTWWNMTRSWDPFLGKPFVIRRIGSYLPHLSFKKKNRKKPLSFSSAFQINYHFEYFLKSILWFSIEIKISEYKMTQTQCSRV